MGFQLSFCDFDTILFKLMTSHKIFAPVNLKGKGAFSGSDLVTYAEINSIKDVVFNRKTSYSPKEVIFPPAETLFYFNEEEFKEPQFDNQKILVFARPCDINAFKRLDAIFLKNGSDEDYYYKRQRQKIKFILMECGEGFDNCFCVSMGTNKTNEYSILIRPAGDSVNCLVSDKELEPFFSNCSEAIEIEPQFTLQNKVSVNIPELQEGINILENPIWEQYNSRCIACGRCNLSCPTCSCFTMQDVFYRDNSHCGERRRVWASCMVDGFTEIAGGHNFRIKHGERMRFKVMHKFNDFKRRFGFHMCVGCGRCEDVCPEYISITRCINELCKAEGVKEDGC